MLLKQHWNRDASKWVKDQIIQSKTTNEHKIWKTHKHKKYDINLNTDWDKPIRSPARRAVVV